MNMSDGGGESGRAHEQPSTRRKSSDEDFSQAVAKIAVAQICESSGFQTFQQSALETLADITVRYISNIGQIAHRNADLSGRTECNAFDTIQALEDLGSTQGFSGASEIDRPFGSSGILGEISRYMVEAEEIPFSYSLPRFPVVKERKLAPSFLQIGEEPPGEHIPAWLPAFPDPHAYIQSPSGNGAAEPRTTKIEQAEPKSPLRPLMNLQHRFFNGFEAASPVDSRDPLKVKQAVESNPFLAAPLQYGEKEVSPLVIPRKLAQKPTAEDPAVERGVPDIHISAVEAFAPAIESIKNDSRDSEDKLSLNRKSTVKFKIGARKKSIGAMTDVRIVNEEFEKVSPWFTGENEKDDKKRRAEKILRDSMENYQELAPL